MASTQDSSDYYTIFCCQLGERCESGKANAPTQNDDVFPAFFQLEALAKRTCNIEFVAGGEEAHAPCPASLELVKEFNLLGWLVDPIHAHGAAHPDLCTIGRRAKEMEHLARVGGQGMIMHLQNEVLVFLVDPFIRDHICDKLSHQSLRVSICIVRPKSGIGIFVTGTILFCIPFVNTDGMMSFVNF